ncbi:MAG: RNA pseudouridine synthase [Pirellulaceae bacterium]
MTPIKILHDGGSVLAVRKPAGLSTQAPIGAESLESRLRDQLQSRRKYVAFPHRLDRPVSGVILVALTKRTARLLSDQFATRKIEKTYLAWVEGIYAGEELWQDSIRKIADQPRGEVCEESADGAKQAETKVQIMRSDTKSGRTLLRLSPVTGRMHQLRIQAAHRGHAIVGDGVYGSANSGSTTAAKSRIFLHAHSITFHDPKNGRQTRVECPDDDFDAAV